MLYIYGSQTGISLPLTLKFIIPQDRCHLNKLVLCGPRLAAAAQSTQHIDELIVMDAGVARRQDDLLMVPVDPAGVKFGRR
jgi:hypothetical protein